MKVAVVGAGAAGLIALQKILESGWADDVVCFEKSDHIGGAWVYREEGENSMYENLRTNLPRQCMGFLDHEFPGDLPTFIGHKQVYAYLEEFARMHKLEKHIYLQSTVVHVDPMNENHPHNGAWKISWDSADTSVRQSEVFDYVVICNGHYSTPCLPDIPGISQFKGKIIHSNLYRNNREYCDQKVVIHGSGASAADIAMEIVPVAQEVYQCKRLDSPAPFNYKAKGINVKGNLVEVDESGSLLLEDGTKLDEIDAIIFCTGFHYDFPFLDGERSKIEVKYKRVCDLLYHIFPFGPSHVQYNSNDEITSPPTIAFIGLPWKVIPFPLFDVQARYLASIWSGQAHLPSPTEIISIMNRETKFHENANLPPHYLHCLGTSQFVYCKRLLKLIGCANLCSRIDDNKSMAIVTKYIRISIPNYKDYTLVEERKGKFKYLAPT